MTMNGTAESIRAGLDRRAFLQGTASAALLGAWDPGRATPQEQAQLIVRSREPENLEFPFTQLNSFITSNESFYVRNHFPQPRVDGRAWRLRVEGAVDRPLELSLDDLRGMASRTQTALLECAGNNRSFLRPQVRGVQWDTGAVGNADWAGVPLTALLDRAGVRNNAVDVILEGADRGTVAEPSSPGAIHFARSLPLAKARQPEVLLAHRMNGAELPAPHGFPLRAVVPGWYGMASVKWLTRVIVSDRPFHGFFQSMDYTYFERLAGLPNNTPITELQVKAVIAQPARGERLPRNEMVRVHGAAWTGESEVSRVEVSSDAGRTWAQSRLLEPNRRYCWRLWEYNWRTPNQAGPVTLLVRATDARGRTQPERRDADRRTYMINHLLPWEVEVR
jgi:DMSO/TMAO reductase YedYZ molybdopterin-dependent catalytic subunit